VVSRIHLIKPLEYAVRKKRSFVMAIRSVIAVAALLVASLSQAAATQGISPTINIAGTGAVSGYGATSFINGASNGTYSLSASAPLVYKETWDTPQDISGFMLNGSARTFGGTIMVATTLGGPCDTPLAIFAGIERESLILNAPAQGVYGIEIVFDWGYNSPTDGGCYQFGQLAILSSPRSLANLASGMTTVNGGFYNTGYNGSVTDSSLGADEWRAQSGLSENWVGFEVPDDGTVDITHLYVVGGPRHGSVYMWRDFEVQVKQNGVWSDTLIRVNVAAGLDTCWIDLGEEMTVQGVRIYGSTAGGNNYDVIMSEIMAFNFSIPEPATMSLLALGGLAMLRRRK